MILPNNYVRRLFVQRIVSSAVLVAFVITAAGIPLPVSSGSRQSDERYPCESCACGCNSAEYCWRSCCCHTLEERITWAERHHLRPPRFAIVAAREAGMELSWLANCDSTRPAFVAPTSSCAERTCNSRPACCKNKSDRVVSSKMKMARTCCSESHDRPTEDGLAREVVGWRALGCHGLSLNWLAATPTLIGLRVELVDHLPWISWLGQPVSELAVGVSDTPVPPPPQHA